MNILKLFKKSSPSIVAQSQGGSDKKVAVVLSGCGVYDGSEIIEAVSAILAVEKFGAKCAFFAPNVPQADVVDHLSGKQESSARNVLQESARIARGKISNLDAFKAEEFDALLFPGGFGAAKNLSSFAFDGTEAKLLPKVESAVLNMFNAKKPIGFVCISPASVGAVALGRFGVELTIGSDKATAEAVEALGAKHVVCEASNFVKDKAHKVYSTPAFMSAKSALEAYMGIEKMIKAILNDK